MFLAAGGGRRYVGDPCGMAGGCARISQRIRGHRASGPECEDAGRDRLEQHIVEAEARGEEEGKRKLESTC